INAFSSEPVTSLPVQLKNGTATFDGVVTGKLSSPQIAGAVAASHFVYAGIEFDGFTGQVSVDQSSLQVKNGALKRGATQAQIDGSIGLADWKSEPASPLTATLAVKGAEISELLDLS